MPENYQPHVELQFIDLLGNPIVGMTCHISCCGNDQTFQTDGNGNIPIIKTNAPDDQIHISVEKLEGGRKQIGTVKSSILPKFVQVKSQAIKVEVNTQKHDGSHGTATATRPKETGPASGAPAVKIARNEEGHPVAVVTSGVNAEKSSGQWHSRFREGKQISDLRKPFQENFRAFYDALIAAGVKVQINTTFRPPQRSYLMYYAAEIVNGKLSPEKIPPFVPQKGDEKVNIDWAHRGQDGKADLKTAKKAAEDMYSHFGARGAIGKPYSSNHNTGNAVDITLEPKWGIGKSIKSKDGTSTEIKSKKDIMAVGASYGVYHWDYYGHKRKKKDEVHWSTTGN